MQVWTWYVEAKGGHRYREATRLPLRLRVHRGEDPLHAAALEAQVVVGCHREEAVRVHAQYQRPPARQGRAVGEGDHRATEKPLEGGAQSVPAQ